MKTSNILAIATISFAASLPAISQESEKAMEIYRLAFKAVVKCGSDYARKSARINATPTEIADAARSVCADEYSEAEITLQNWSRIRLIERGARREDSLINAGAAEVADMAIQFRRFVVSEVIDERTETAK